MHGTLGRYHRSVPLLRKAASVPDRSVERVSTITAKDLMSYARYICNIYLLVNYFKYLLTKTQPNIISGDRLLALFTNIYIYNFLLHTI